VAIGEGWLIGRLLDYRHARSGIAVLDAEHISDGAEMAPPAGVEETEECSRFIEADTFPK
jgi:hypothetical protein